MSRPLDSVMVRTVLGPLLACLQIFALYVLVHGHISPGGGFQAGALLGAGMILAGLVDGPRSTLGPRAALGLVVAGLALYGGLGAAAQAFGAEFLDYAAVPIASTAPLRRHVGILVIEAGVTLAVAGAMVSLFHTLGGDEEVAA